MIPLAFICALPVAIDGDTLRCANGQAVRVAGIEANERRGGCHLPVCPAMPAREARATMQRLVAGKALSCRRVGVSWGRAVAVCALPDGRDLRCAAIASGAAVEWPAYVVRYRLGRCAR